MCFSLTSDSERYQQKSRGGYQKLPTSTLFHQMPLTEFSETVLFQAQLIQSVIKYFAFKSRNTNSCSHYLARRNVKPLTYVCLLA